MKERAKELLHQLAMGRRDCVDELADLMFPTLQPVQIYPDNFPNIDTYTEATVTHQDIPVKTPKAKNTK